MKEPQKKYEPTTKYLAVKDWNKLQAGKDRKGRQIKAWYKDHCTKDFDDPLYSQLTMFQRGLFDAICRATARLGSSWVRSDVMSVASCTCTVPEERHCLGQALTVLVACGLLIPTNQQFALSDSETHTDSDSEEETETKVPSPDATVVSSLREKSEPPVDGSLVASQNQSKAKRGKCSVDDCLGLKSPSGSGRCSKHDFELTQSGESPKPTNLRNWSETIPGCNLDPARIGECIRYQLDVKKNEYFAKRISRAYVLKEWKRIVEDTPDDYEYDPDPLIAERHSNVDSETIVVKYIARKPKNAKERRILQGENNEKITRNIKWLFADPCQYGCKHGLVFISDFPDAPLATQRAMGSQDYCKCLGE